LMLLVLELQVSARADPDSLHGHVTIPPYAYEPGLIARLSGVVLEAAPAYRTVI
jgi:hypothetical protein